MEQWAEFGDPSPAARLAQARALINLRLLDRAWRRLEALVNAQQGGVDAMLLTAEAHLLRGWPSLARKSLERALKEAPDDARIQKLWDQTVDPAPPPDPGAAERDDAPVEALLALAEWYLGINALVKAQALLERVRRSAPSHARANELLWAVKGDFRLDTDDLAGFANKLQPDFGSSLADLGDESEHTESATAEVMRQLELSEVGSFPVLFRNIEAEPDDFADGDVTQVTAMATPDVLAHAPEPTEDSDADGAEDTTSGGDHTEIMIVVQKKNLGDGAGHRAEQHGDKFDLAAKAALPPPVHRAASDLEEDDDRIVRTRASDLATVEPAPAREAQLTVDPKAEMPARPAMDEGAAWAKDGVKPAAAPPKEPPRRPPPPPRPMFNAARQQETAPWTWMLAGASVVLLVGTVLAALVLFELIQGM